LSSIEAKADALYGVKTRFKISSEAAGGEGIGTDAKKSSTSAAEALVGRLFSARPGEGVVASAAEGAKMASEVVVGAGDFIALDVPEST
jgi:hypothetical protein